MKQMALGHSWAIVTRTMAHRWYNYTEELIFEMGWDIAKMEMGHSWYDFNIGIEMLKIILCAIAVAKKSHSWYQATWESK